MANAEFDPTICQSCGFSEIACQCGHGDIGDHLEQPGCFFPDRCLMPGPHFPSECCTVEMYEDYVHECLQQDDEVLG